MAQLTWRSVEAPDFSQAMRGIRDFGSMFNDAFAGLKDGLKTYDNTLVENADRSLALDMAAAQDADAAKNILSHIATRGGRAPSLDAIQAATTRPGQLLQEANSKLNLDQGVYNFDRLKTGNAALDSARPAAAKLLQASFAGNDGEAASILANSPELANLSIDQLMSLGSKSQEMVKGNVGIASDRQAMTIAKDNNTRAWNEDGRAQGRYGMETVDFQNRQTDRAEARQVETQVGSLMETIIPGDVDSARAAVFSGALSKANPLVRARVYGEVSKLFPGVFSPEDLGVSAPSLGSASGSGTALDMTYGGGALPANIKTVGDVVANKKSLVRSLGASPVGMYQINADTWADFGPKALGSGWKNADVRDPAVQEKVGKAIFNSARGSAKALRGRWASIKSDAEAEMIRQMPWEQAREYIARGETSSSPAAVIAAAARRSTQDNAGRGDIDAYMRAGQNNGNVFQAVNYLRRQPEFKGTSETFLKEQLQGIFDRSMVNGRPTVNMAQAAQILKNALTEKVSDNEGKGSAARRIWNSIQGNSVRVGNGWRLNNDIINRELGRFRSGSIDGDISTAQQRALDVQQLQAAQAQVNRAEALYRSAAAAARFNPRMDLTIPKARLDQARRAAQILSQKVEGRNAPVRETENSKPTGGGLLSFRRIPS